MTPVKQKLMWLTVAGLLTSKLHAADIATDASAGSGAHDNSNGGYFEFGVGLNIRGTTDELRLTRTLLLSGAYRYRGVFFEAFTPSIGASRHGVEVDGITIGINLWNDNRWSVDLLAADTRSRFRNVIPDNDDEDSAAIVRDSLYSGAGLRVTGYFGDTIFQFRLVDDTHGGNGIVSSATLGYSRQLRNWNLHSLLRADYISRETGQYWYSVSADEATSGFPEFEMSSSAVTYSVEIGATYPINQNVVFRSTARYTQIPSEIRESPFTDSRFVFGWNTTLSYVF